MTAALKTVIVDALNKSLKPTRSGYPEIEFVTGYTSDRYAAPYADDQIGVEIEDSHYDTTMDWTVIETAVRDHFFGDRAKVRAAILAGLQQSRHPDLDAAMAAGFNATGFDPEAHIFDDDLFIDAVIAGLAGGSE